MLNLPPGLNIDHVYDYVKAHIPLCIRIRGNLISGERPDELQDGSRYPMSSEIRCSVCFEAGGHVGERCSNTDCEGHVDWLRYVECMYCMRDGWGKDGHACRLPGCQGLWRKKDRMGSFGGSGWIDEIKTYKEMLLCRTCGREEDDSQEGNPCLKHDCDGVMEVTYPVKCDKCQAESQGKHGDRCPDRCGGYCQRLLCGCQACERSGTKRTKFCKIGVTTANHVLFNAKEVKSCEVIIFDNGAEDVDMEVLKGADIRSCNTNADFCEFDVFSHDTELNEKIEELLTNSKSVISELQNELNHSPSSSSSEDSEADGVRDEPVILIGHPHSCQQHVCIGTLKKVVRDDRNEYSRYMKTKVVYEIDSCSGNSGGMVIPFKPRDASGYKRLFAHPHLGRVTNTLSASGGWCKGDK